MGAESASRLGGPDQLMGPHGNDAARMITGIWRGGRVAEGTGLLNRRRGNTLPRVRIPPSPPHMPLARERGASSAEIAARRRCIAPCHMDP